MRDWLSTLWPASFAGVPFWVEKTKESGGRRLVVHEFPMRDDPFIEDLGEAKRDFEVVAYLVGDNADTEAKGLVASFVAAGSAALVLPDQGPVTCRLQTFARDYAKDRMGHVAFQFHFVRDGAASALATVNFIGQLVFDAVDGLAAAAGKLLGSVSL